MPERGSDQGKLPQPEQLLKKIKKLGTESPAVRPKKKNDFPVLKEPFFICLCEVKTRNSRQLPTLDGFGNREMRCRHKWFGMTNWWIEIY